MVNQEQTESFLCGVLVEGYSDGIYNLAIAGPQTDGSVKLEVSREEAERVCDHLGADVPDPDPTPPTQMG